MGIKEIVKLEELVSKSMEIGICGNRVGCKTLKLVGKLGNVPPFLSSLIMEERVVRVQLLEASIFIFKKESAIFIQVSCSVRLTSLRAQTAQELTL